MRAASRPNTVWSMRGVCIAGSIAGWAHTKSSFNRSSGNCGCYRRLPCESSFSSFRMLARSRDATLLVANDINERATRRRHQPSFGILRHAVLRPMGESRH